ncbi:MAG: hypothetical protein AABZ53_09855 [Planctomycetota bacterium]
MKKGRKRRVLLGVLLLIAGLAVPGDLRSVKVSAARLALAKPNHWFVPASLGSGESLAPKRMVVRETPTPKTESASIVAAPAPRKAVEAPNFGAVETASAGWWDPFAFAGVGDEELGEEFDTSAANDYSSEVSMSSGGASAPRFATGAGSSGGSSGRAVGGGGGGGAPGTTTGTGETTSGGGGGGSGDQGDQGDAVDPCAAPGFSNASETLVTFGGEQSPVNIRTMTNEGTIELAAGASVNITQFCASPAWAVHNAETGVITLASAAIASVAGNIENLGTLSLAGDDSLLVVAPGGAGGEQHTLTNESCALIRLASPMGRSTLRCVGVDLVNRGAISGNGTIVFQGESSFDDQNDSDCHTHDLRGMRLRFDQAERNDHSPATLEIGCKDVGNSRQGLESVFSPGTLEVVNSTLTLVSARGNDSSPADEVLYVRTLTVAGSVLDLNGRTVYYKVQGLGGIDLQSVVLNGGKLIKIASCPADFNGDDLVNLFDYLEFVDAFQLGLPSADFDQDGAVDFFDYDAFVVALETPC